MIKYPSGLNEYERLLTFMVPLKNRCMFLSVLRGENVRISDTYWSRPPLPIGRLIAARRRVGVVLQIPGVLHREVATARQDLRRFQF